MKIGIAIRETKQKLVETINGSALPASILTMIVKEVLRQLEGIERAEISREEAELEEENRQKEEETAGETEEKTEAAEKAEEEKD